MPLKTNTPLLIDANCILPLPVSSQGMEFVEGLRSIAAPLKAKNANLIAAIWVMGLDNQIKDMDIPLYSNLLKESASKVEIRLSI